MNWDMLEAAFNPGEDLSILHPQMPSESLLDAVIGSGAVTHWPCQAASVDSKALRRAAARWLGICTAAQAT